MHTRLDWTCEKDGRGINVEAGCLVLIQRKKKSLQTMQKVEFKEARTCHQPNPLGENKKKRKR
jgi:hypothetical protein